MVQSIWKIIWPFLMKFNIPINFIPKCFPKINEYISPKGLVPSLFIEALFITSNIGNIPNIKGRIVNQSWDIYSVGVLESSSDEPATDVEV